ncbi:hypothetical protein H0H93_009756 [Arthromyces matolae]|nr:hypothetical protein H0H93_009756 [Arthromyces matolae]
METTAESGQPGNGQGITQEDTPSADISEDSQFLKKEYNKYLKEKLGDKWNDKDAKAELFKPIIEWYNQKYIEAIKGKKIKGNFSLIIRKVVDAFEKMGLKFYELCGLHCGGAVLNVDPDVTGRTDSALWGSTPELDKIKKGEVVFINHQLKQLESLVMYVFLLYFVLKALILL